MNRRDDRAAFAEEAKRTGFKTKLRNSRSKINVSDELEKEESSQSLDYSCNKDEEDNKDEVREAFMEEAKRAGFKTRLRGSRSKINALAELAKLGEDRRFDEEGKRDDNGETDDRELERAEDTNPATAANDRNEFRKQAGRAGFRTMLNVKRGNSTPSLPGQPSSQEAQQFEDAHIRNGDFEEITPRIQEIKMEIRGNRKMEEKLVSASPNEPETLDQHTLNVIEESDDEDEGNKVNWQSNIPEYQSSDEDDVASIPQLSQTFTRYSDVLRNVFQTLTYEQLLSQSCTEFLFHAFKAYETMSKSSFGNSQELQEQSTQEYAEMYQILRKTVMATENYFDADAFQPEGKGADGVKQIFKKSNNRYENSISMENQNLLCDKLQEFSQLALQRLNVITEDNSMDIVQLVRRMLPNREDFECQNSAPAFRLPKMPINPSNTYENKPEEEQDIPPILKPKSNYVVKTRDDKEPEHNKQKNEAPMPRTTSHGTETGENNKKEKALQSSTKRLNLMRRGVTQDFVPKKVISVYENITRTHLQEVTVENLHLEDEQTFFTKINEDFQRQEKVKPTGDKVEQHRKDTSTLYNILKAKVLLMEEAFDNIICFLEDEMAERCTQLFSPDDTANVPSRLLEVFQSKIRAFSQEYVERNEIILNAERNSASELIDNSVKFYNAEMEKNLVDNNLDEEALQSLHLQISETTIENFLTSYDCKNPQLTIQFKESLQTKILESQEMLLEDYERRRVEVQTIPLRDDGQANSPPIGFEGFVGGTYENLADQPDQDFSQRDGQTTKTDCDTTHPDLFDELNDLPLSPSTTSPSQIPAGPDNWNSNPHDSEESDGFEIIDEESPNGNATNEAVYQTRTGVAAAQTHSSAGLTSPLVTSLPADRTEVTPTESVGGPPIGWNRDVLDEEPMDTLPPLDEDGGIGHKQKIKIGFGARPSIKDRLKVRKPSKSSTEE